MKKCSMCKQIKPLECFTKNKSRKDGIHNHCKICHNEQQRSYRKKYREVLRPVRAERKKNWALKNPEKSKAMQAKADSKWKKKNPGKWAAISAKYRAARIQRTPPWLTKDHFQEIQLFYKRAENESKKMGIKMHVDHIVPLQGETVSGLHVPWNLQVIPRSINCSKSNRV